MARRRISTCDYDPFEFTLIYRGRKDTHTAWLSIIGVVIVALLLLVTYVSGTLGTFQDFQLWTDIRRVLKISNTSAATPEFPFMRDVTSWFLIFAIITGTLLLHRQWQYMARCLSQLAGNGVLVHRPKRSSNLFSKLLGVDRMVAGVSQEEALNRLVHRVVGALARRTSWLTLSLIIVSIVLAQLLALGEQKDGLFQTLAPSGLAAAARTAWLDNAYGSWWAGTHHVFGYLLYQVLAVFAIFIVLSFQTAGICAVYVMVAMHFIVEPSADWLNRDGRYGWAPLAYVYRTVVWSNASLGATLTVILVALGLGNYGWVLGLVVLYIIVIPISIIVPWITFRRVERNAKKLRIAEIEAAITSHGIDEESDIALMAPYVLEIDRCQAVRIRPLRLGTASFSTYVLLAVLPILLTVAQILFPLKFNGK